MSGIVDPSREPINQPESVPAADAVPEWLGREFANGYAPCDEPPGFEERWYRTWKEQGGRVLPPELRETRRGQIVALPHFDPEEGLRDHFAGVALSAIACRPSNPDTDENRRRSAAAQAADCYMLADAMLAARKARANTQGGTPS